MLLIRVLFSTALVLGAIWYCARMVRQPRGIAARLRLPGTSALVESRTSLNRSTVLAVVRFADQQILVAANEQAVTVLANAPAVEVTAPAPIDAVVSLDESAEAPVAQLSAVQDALAPSNFLDVLRSYTVRTTVGPK